MQIRNNHDKEVFNGDMGRILRIDDAMNTLEEALEDWMEQNG